jgi:toxin ParE1/3/4
MSRECIITELADLDILEISIYIGQDDIQAAVRFIDEINERFELLMENPLAGRQRPELRPGLRGMPFGSYMIFYRPTDNGIEVDRVLHGARNIGRIYRET